jgi:hypothetical protein
VKHKAVAVGREYEGNVEGRCIFQPLLHAVPDAVRIVLGLDQRQRNVGLEIENVVDAFGLAARHQLAAHDDAALGEADLFADLRHFIPSRPLDRRRDELGADVAFAKGALVHCGHANSRFGLFIPPLHRHRHDHRTGRA